MKTILLILIIIFLGKISYSQTELDVIRVSKLYSDNNICNIQHRIINQSLVNDTFRLTIGAVINCSGVMNVKSFYDKDTVNILYEEGEISMDTTDYFDVNEKIIVDSVELFLERPIKSFGLCLSDCYLEIEFLLKPMMNLPKFVKINSIEYQYYPDRFRTYALQFEIINGDTINVVDKNGLPQGKWNRIFCMDEIPGNQHSVICRTGGLYCYLCNMSHEFSGFYENGEAKTAVNKALYPKGSVKFKLIQSDFDVMEEERYDENGQLQYKKQLNSDDFMYFRYKYTL